jgi:hypothetical protein
MLCHMIAAILLGIAAHRRQTERAAVREWVFAEIC